MALVKRVYSDGNTVITAQNLNDIQDEVIANGNNKVNKAGDTMTGQLITANSIDNPIKILNTNVVVGETPSAAEFQSVAFTDNNSSILGQVRGGYLTDKRGTISLIANNGLGSTNSLSLYVSESGSPTVFLSAPTQWRSQLGLGTSGAFPITIAQGGTGQTQANAISTVSDVCTAASGITISTAYYAYWGRIALVHFSVKSSNQISANTWTTLLTINSGKRPIYEIAGCLHTPCITANTRLRGTGAVDIKSATNIAANTTIVITGTYLIAN